MAQQGIFAPQNKEVFGRESFSKKADAKGYTVVTDTRGSLLWPDQKGAETPLLVITSQQVTREYLAYLDLKNISWIACGEEKIDLGRAVEILAGEFGVARMAVVGGGGINAGFLAAGLLDEVSILLAPGIDGRRGMTAVFDGLPMDANPIPLKLKNLTSYEDGAVWLQYSVEKQ